MRDDEEGVTIVIVAVSMLALIGMVVLVVDVGAMLTTRREMVRAADAAALAAAVSCARSNPAEMQSKADEFATANKSGAVATATNVTPTGSCGTKAGEVDVTYSTPQEMVFAPVLGFPSAVDIDATATAMWGPSGEVIALPIMISESAFNRCGFDMSYSGGGSEQQCGIWYDNDEIGNSQWGFVNFYLWGVDPAAQCNNSGAASQTWIVHGEKKHTHYPTPTYACADAGLVASDWHLLDGEAGKIKYFPIAGGQVDKSGNPTVGGNVDKYNIVGFAGLRIVSATKKNGSQTVTGSCSITTSVTPGQMIPLLQLTEPGCPAGAIGTIIDPPVVKIGDKVAVEGTDYTYEPTTSIVTWTGQTEQNVTVDFTWTQPGETVTCGGEPKNSSTVCLVVSWPGAQIAGSNPTRTGKDFGVRSVRLLGSSQ